MSFPLRRVAPSKAARVVSVGVLGVTLGVPAANASPARPGFVAQGACSGSTVTREYTPEAMTFRLHLDLDRCRWWDGSARNLVIWLSRDDGAGPASRYSMAACEAGSDPSSRTTACEVFATLPHPAEEEAVTYQGEATWEWHDGTRRVSFDTHCTTAQNHARCDDPVATWHD
ncbi:MAG: hypothetical protein ACRDYF_10735 [Acidimicrobiia bacterium]